MIEDMTADDSPLDRPTMTVAEAAQLLGISRNSAFGAARRPIAAAPETGLSQRARRAASCSSPREETIAVHDLSALGWAGVLAEPVEAAARAGLIPGRVSVQHRGAYDVLTTEGELRCDVAGRLYEEAGSPADLPAVGDWVAVAARPDERAGTVQAVLPRRTKFSRKTAWQASEEQVLAANVDVVLIVTSLNEEMNLRRLERYLTLAWESGARPVLVLKIGRAHV